MNVAHLLGSLLVAALVGSTALAEVATVESLLALEMDRVAAGVDVYTIEAEAGVSVPECVRLPARQPAVVASGAVGLVEPAQTVRFARSPGVEYPVTPMTPGALAVLSDRPISVSGSGWVVGDGVAEELGLVAGSRLAASDTGEAAPVIAVLSTSRRDTGYGRDVIELHGGWGRARTCWVEMDPSARNVASGVLASSFPDLGEEDVVRPFARREGAGIVDVAVAYEERTTRLAWLGSGMASSVVLIGLALLRRRELALYRAFGVTTWGMAVLAATWMMPLLVAAGGLAGAAVAVGSRSTAGFEAGIWTVVTAILVAFLGGGVGMGVVSGFRIDRTIKHV